MLTCRSGQYQALRTIQVWTHDAARVEIRAVDSVKAAQFIHSRVDDATRWQPVLSTITNHPGGTLAVGLSTPWRLTLATTVYEQREPESGTYLRDPVALTMLGATSPEAVRDHLLEHFIPAAIAAHETADEHPYSDGQVHQWLRVLARYLDHNARTGRTLGGVPLSGTDLVLHQLWPLAGVNRVRMTILAALALSWLAATSILFTQAGLGFSARPLFGVGAPIVSFAFIAYISWSELWPKPARFNVRKLRTKKGRRHFAGRLAFGLVNGLAIGLAGGLASGLASNLVGGLTFGLVGGLTFGLASGLVGGLAFGLVGGLASDTAATLWDPREIVKLDLAVGLTSGLMLGLAFGLAFGFAAGLVGGLASGLVTGLTIGLTGGLTGGLVAGLAGTRYVALLLCTRRQIVAQPMPWRLGKFLNWCYEAGLVRQAGISYQFRHRELQYYLAHS